MMKENFSAIPEEMLQMSDRFATAINLVSDMAASSTEAQQRILDGVEKIHIIIKGGSLLDPRASRTVTLKFDRG
jgi:hypothetical protein